jgi:PhnB protein
MSSAETPKLQTARIDRARFWLADESLEHFNFSPETLGSGSVRLVLSADDSYVVFERTMPAGAKQLVPVAVQPYGWRVRRAVDPFGHHWEIGGPLL